MEWYSTANQRVGKLLGEKRGVGRRDGGRGSGWKKVPHRYLAGRAGQRLSAQAAGASHGPSAGQCCSSLTPSTYSLQGGKKPGLEGEVCFGLGRLQVGCFRKTSAATPSRTPRKQGGGLQGSGETQRKPVCLQADLLPLTMTTTGSVIPVCRLWSTQLPDPTHLLLWDLWLLFPIALHGKEQAQE